MSRVSHLVSLKVLVTIVVLNPLACTSKRTETPDASRHDGSAGAAGGGAGGAGQSGARTGGASGLGGH